MRGAGEGHRGFDLGPKSTMTNGTVGNEVKGASGDTLTVAYKGGEKSIVVPPGAPVVMFAPGDKAMLVPGAHVIVQTKAAAGGTLTAERVTVGKDGLVPPCASEGRATCRRRVPGQAIVTSGRCRRRGRSRREAGLTGRSRAGTLPGGGVARARVGAPQAPPSDSACGRPPSRSGRPASHWPGCARAP